MLYQQMKGLCREGVSREAVAYVGAVERRLYMALGVVMKC